MLAVIIILVEVILSPQFRLLFHDCMPYKGQSGKATGGCDGCLNFEKNGHEHNVLQHSVAILVINIHVVLRVLEFHFLS